jgi:hypothetical protein
VGDLAGLGSAHAREPSERRPTIHARLPLHFLPPQVTIVSTQRSTDAVLFRILSSRASAAPLSHDDVLFWRGDVLD